GAKPQWENVRFKMIPSAPARVAALLAGDVQMIEGVPTADIAKLSKDARVDLSSAVSNRIIYLHMDSGREKNSPFVTTTDGKPMEANPLRDPKVRKAISKMVDRDAIVSRIMEGQAVAAGQLLPEQFFGTSKALKPEKYDPEGAKKLLAEAGYPNGFGITLHAPNNRYINDAAIAQAVAQYLTRNGIPTKERFLLARLQARVQLPAGRLGGGDRGNLLAAARAAGHLRPEAGPGHRQPGALFRRRRRRADRAGHHRRASEKAVGELTGLVPLHYEVSTWGTKKGLAYKARADQYTFAYDVKSTR
ncbi:MAG: ABC transporter substrate-binding protein, partial [Burkholderiaceae bacterium]|nr:ABC transporter substrate-binding protein [Burkholderiaceae bacterium]